MSDYGFATYDERTGRLSEKINSKYPIFGPEYKNIASQYKTISLVDTKVNKVSSLPSSGVTIPTDNECWEVRPDTHYGENGGPQGIYRDEIIYQAPHGFKKRPLGYAVITGTLVMNFRYVLVQDQVSGLDMGGDFRVPYSGEGTLSYSYGLAPSMGKLAPLSNTVVIPWNDPYVNVIKANSGSTDGIIIKNGCDNAFVRPLEVNTLYNGTSPVDQSPYRVVIDDTEVKIYRRTFWHDSIARVYYNYQFSNYNVNQRTKIVSDYAGTHLDVTLYLVPYSMEDLR